MVDVFVAQVSTAKIALLRWSARMDAAAMSRVFVSLAAASATLAGRVKIAQNIPPVQPTMQAASALSRDRVNVTAVCASQGSPERRVPLHSDALTRVEVRASAGQDGACASQVLRARIAASCRSAVKTAIPTALVNWASASAILALMG